LAGILLRLLRRDPADRYPSASRLLEELCRASGRAPASGPAPAGTLLASRLIGRREILDHLREALRGAREGRGAALVLEGPEGAGKSRLLREFRLLAAIDGARVGRGRGLAERPSALGPVLQALSSVGIEPKCGPLNSLAEADPHARFRIYGTVAQSLAEQSVGSPLVLLLDDLHLAGQGSEELLAFLAEELSTLPVLVVACRRPGLTASGSRR
jgi:predicted ATPase